MNKILIGVILMVVFMCGMLIAFGLRVTRLSRRKPYRQISRAGNTVVEGSSGIPLKDTTTGKLGATIHYE